MLPTVNPNKDWQQNVQAPAGAITTSTLAPTPTVNYQTPPETPIYPVGAMQPSTQTQTTDPASLITMTEPETQLSALNKRIMDLNNQGVGESAYRAEQENAQGIVGLNQTKADLTSRFNALKNEALAIPLQLQQQATGRGITAAGLQPHQTAALRNNAIQALSVNSLLEAANGNLTTAMQMVDRAVAQKFDPIKEQIAAATANAQLIKDSPEYTIAEKKRAQAVIDAQAAKERLIARQEEDWKSAHAMAAAAIKNNPNNPAVSIAAQQALNLDPSDPQYLQKIFGLIGQYQTDPNALQAQILDLQLKREQIANAKNDRDLAWANYNLDKTYKNAQIASMQADAAKTSSEAAAATTGAQSTVSTGVELINSLLNDKNLKFASGSGVLNPFTHLPGNTANPVKNQLNQLNSLLSLESRGKLKGQGAVSDFEGRTLARSASALGIGSGGYSNLSQKDLERELRKVRGVFQTASGGAALVRLTNKNGQSQTIQATRAGIDQAIKDGLTVEYQ